MALAVEQCKEVSDLSSWYRESAGGHRVLNLRTHFPISYSMRAIYTHAHFKLGDRSCCSRINTGP